MKAGEQSPSRPLLLAEIVFTIFVAIFCLYWNPFDLWSRFDAGGRALLMNVFSVEYPKDHPRTGVVLVGDDFLREWDYPWPLPLSAHAEIIEQISAQRPKAIFVDFLFIDRREQDIDIAQFAQTIDRLASETDIYIASAPASADDLTVLRELSAVARSNPRVRLVSVELDTQAQDRVLYPLDSVGGMRRAAFEMASAAYPAKTVALEQRGLKTLDVFWPAPPPETNCKDFALERECQAISKGAFSRALRLSFSGLFRVDIRALRLPEPYRLNTYPVPTLRATELLEGDDAHAELLQDAFVFYGGDFEFTSNDAVQTPIYGARGRRTLPGVFSHAVAFDNLVALGPDRVIAGHPPFGLTHQHFTALLVVVVCLAAGLLWTIAVLFTKAPSVGSRWSIALRTARSYQFWLIPAYVTVVAGAFLLLRVTPAFWLTVLTVASLRYTLPWVGGLKIERVLERMLAR